MANPPWNKGPIQSTANSISYARKRFVYMFLFVLVLIRFMRTLFPFKTSLFIAKEDDCKVKETTKISIQLSIALTTYVAQ